MHGHTTSEPILPPSGEGTVVLDIGGEMGAAVIYTDSALSGSEIEIRPQGRPWEGVHTGVRQRDMPDEVCFAAVFGSIAAGSYQLRIKGTDSEPIMAIEIAGGGIAEANWPTG
jgi:5-enolpyruvylshikimate-3-phosphate synthase